MIDEKKLYNWIKAEINPYGKPFEGTVFEFGNKVMNHIKAMEKQPKTDWIPCEERLPELDEGTESFKQSKCCLVTLEWWDGEITEEVGWYNQSGVWNQDSKNCKVIAWQPLPQPYKKEGAE